MTVGQAYAEFEQRKKDIADVDDIAGTFLKWCNYMNLYAYNQLANIMPESYIKTQVYTTVPGIESYALPTDFQDIIPQGTGMYLIGSNSVNTDQRQALTNFGSSKSGIYINATKIFFTPKPTNSKSYNFRYIPLLAELTTTGSVLLIPDRFSQHIMNALDQLYNIWDEDNNAEVFNDSRFINSMNELVALINPIGQMYSLPDFSGDF